MRTGVMEDIDGGAARGPLQPYHELYTLIRGREGKVNPVKLNSETIFGHDTFGGAPVTGRRPRPQPPPPPPTRGSGGGAPPNPDLRLRPDFGSNGVNPNPPGTGRRPAFGALGGLIG